MKQKPFLIQLGIISSGLLLILLYLNSLSTFQESAQFTWLVFSLFILLTLGVFFIGRSSSMSSDRNAFSRVVLSVMMIKMMLCILLVVAYIKIQNTEDRNFMIPFFLIYIVYTIFEVIVMTKLGKNNSPKNV